MKTKLFSFLAATLTVASLCAAPQAVVFDFGGVMTNESDREAVVRYIRATMHLSESEFETVNQAKRLAVKQGKTDEEFWLSYAKENQIPLSADWVASFNAVMKAAIGVNPDMYALVNELKRQNIPVALLSNIDERLSKLIRDFGYYEPFDFCLLSCDVGLAKPDLKIYQHLLDKLGFPPEEVVFIDDKLENVAAAKVLGLDAILFESPEQIRKELSKRAAL